jgi:AraC-like DNA-binding protein
MNQNQLIPSRYRDGAYGSGNEFVVASADMRGLPAYGENETWRKVERTISYMVEHINQPLQVSTLAAQVNVSPSHFFSLFKQRMGCPPIDYFTRLRMGQARRILDSTSASVKEVAAALGYDDPFYFSRVFKSVHKIPPSEYRTRQKAEKIESKHFPENAPKLPILTPCNSLGIERSGSRREGANPDKKVLLSIP